VLRKGTVLEQKLNTSSRAGDFVSSHPASISLTLTVVLFAVTIAILRPGYGTNDDIQVIAVASGYMGGTPFPFLIFNNVLVGFVLNFFYGLNSTINWEIWLFITIHFCSTWGLIYLVLWHPLKLSSKSLGSSIILLSSIYFVLNLTFTTVAAVASISGLCLLLTAVQLPGMLRQSRFLLGVVLILTGSLLRLESTELVLAILIPSLVICYRFFPIKNLILACVTSSTLVLGCYAFNLLYLHQYRDWYFFNAYSLTRTMVQDTPRLVNAAGSLGAIHWTANDLNMFARWFFPDPNVYSLQNLRYLVEHVSDKRPTFLRRLFLLPLHFLNETILPYTLLLLLTWTSALFHGFTQKKGWISSCSLFLVTLAINIYLLWTQKLADYVFLASMDSCVIFTLFIGYWSALNAAQRVPAPETSNFVSPKSEVPSVFRNRFKDILYELGLYANILLLLIVTWIVVQESIKTTTTNIRREAVYHSILSDIRLLHLEDTGQKSLIITPAFGIPWEWSNPLFVDFPHTPHYLVMDWNTFSPAYDSVLRAYQVGSLPAGLYEGKNIYLMTDETTMNGILKFIENHEGVKVEARLIYTPNYDTGTIYDESRLYKLERLP
jgi:hypothetical protein